MNLPPRTVGLVLAALLAAGGAMARAEDAVDDAAPASQPTTISVPPAASASQPVPAPVLVPAHVPAAATPAPPIAPLHYRVSGYLQADARLVDQGSSDQLNQTSGQPLNDERFVLRRGRIRLDADRGAVSGSLELDGDTVSGPTARVISGEVTLGWHGLVAATVGLFKIPFGADTQTRTQTRLFLEPTGFVRALFPGEYDVGLMVHGGWRFVRWQLAATDGEPVGEKSFPGRDPNAAKDWVGRLGVDVDAGGGVRVEAGVSGLDGTGFHPGTPATKDTLVWRDQNEDGLVQQSELMVIPGRPATPSANFDRFALGGDARVTVPLPRVGALSVSFELAWAGNLDRVVVQADPVGVGRDLRELGWLVAVSQEVGRWGVLGLRYDEYDPDADATEQIGAHLVPRDNRISRLSLAAAWRVADGGVVTAEYDHDTNTLGRSPSGSPETLAADTFTVRAQVSF